jgi:hypothetical protein
MYLSVEEFDLMYPLTKDVPYGYRCITNKEDDIEEYVLTLKNNMLDDIQEILYKESSRQKFEENNSFKAEELYELADSIYYNLKYGLDDDIY